MVALLFVSLICNEGIPQRDFAGTCEIRFFLTLTVVFRPDAGTGAADARAGSFDGVDCENAGLGVVFVLVVVAEIVFGMVDILETSFMLDSDTLMACKECFPRLRSVLLPPPPLAPTPPPLLMLLIIYLNRLF